MRVKDGYARNFLIPQRIARRATVAAIAEFEAKRAELEKQLQKIGSSSSSRRKIERFDSSNFPKAGVDGRLFWFCN